MDENQETPNGNDGTVAGIKYKEEYRYLYIEDASPEEFEFFGVAGEKGFRAGSEIKTFEFDNPWIWSDEHGNVLELYGPDYPPPSGGPRLSLILHSDEEVTYHFSYWALPRHRANTSATFRISPKEDEKATLFTINWSHSTPSNCPGRHYSRSGTAGFGSNRFNLAYWWFPNLGSATYWADCRPGFSLDKAQSRKNP